MTLLTLFERNRPRRRSILTLEFKLQDLWLGAFWKRERRTGARQFDVWICLLPCLPLHFKSTTGNSFQP